MKRILFANFAECPENLHFEQAFIRGLKDGACVSLDIIHDFRFPYSFIKNLPPPGGGRRIRPASLAGLKRELERSYDLLALLDFPKRKSCAAAFVWLLKNLECQRKVFLANHLLPMPGHNPTADIVRKLKLLRVLDAAHILEFDDRDLWMHTGLEAAKIFKRGYGVDCRYYRPGGEAGGDYVFSAGSAGRDFSELARAVKRTGLALKIFSDAKLPPFGTAVKGSVEALPFAGNLHNLKSAALGARLVALPIADSHINEAAGNSIAFIAMALGKPVIIRRTRYMERFIEDGKTGFFYEKLSAASLARQFDRALSLTPAALKNLGRSARAVILKKASLDAIAARFAGEFVFNP
ncbi:MAG: glycosyltransferase [Elusimicrobia bacterium]|nr:glycosyltransferase [Elusimicrobiota bacterium]